VSATSRQVRQVDAERFEVVEPTGTVSPVMLRRDTRAGLGLRAIAPSVVVAEAVAMLDEDGRWPPPTPSGPVDAVGLLAVSPGALDELRSRLSG